MRLGQPAIIEEFLDCGIRRAWCGQDSKCALSEEDEEINLWRLQSTVTKRSATLEKEFVALRRELNQPKDWRRAVGTLRDTKLAREAGELGRQYLARERRASPPW